MFRLNVSFKYYESDVPVSKYKVIGPICILPASRPKTKLQIYLSYPRLLK